MASTTNFNFPTPDDTDLVKDGAAAIRTLGSAIDTSLVDLKGGTTGQVLSKASNTDLDYSWTTPNVGDITEVQAGTGISIADGTGPIPIITNTVATEFDAKGDLIVGTGADTFDKLSVGTNDYILTADSSTATGLKWAAPYSPAYKGVSLYNYYTTVNSTPTPFAMPYAGTEGWDTDGFHSTASNTSRITIPTGLGGKYLITMSGWPETFNTYFIQSLFLNGTDITGAGTTGIALHLGNMARKGALETETAGLVLLLSAGDYIEQFIQQGGTSASYRYITNFQATFLGA